MNCAVGGRKLSRRTVATGTAAVLASAVLVALPEPARAATEDRTLATWNVQGSAARWAAVGNLAVKRNVVALQEVSARPPANVGREQKLGPNLSGWKWNVGTNSRPHYRHLFILRHSSKNLGLVTDWAPASGSVVEIPGKYRPLLCVRDNGNAALLCSLHASAKGGGDAATLVKYAAAYAAQNKARSWAVLGDYNRAPAKLQQDPALPSAAHLYAPNRATQQSGGILDYLVSNVVTTKWKAKVLVNKGSDHWAVQW
ncbi:endonuclease/exonuclease/phosphatase family protein [Streptomyces sp. NPDC052496]|uniref:endonuclease/exonuclease/phosphatase family protein n=1 Tax=Streptomyces sp. NPDC052496 TaxID=3154951 RepID=UPI0034348D1E